MTCMQTLGIALACASVLAGAKPKPKPKPKPTAAAAPASSDLALAGSSAELMDLNTGKGRAVGPLPESLTDFQTTVFADGRVLLTGGSMVTSASHWFDPATRQFTPGPALTQPRQGHRALLLADGRLLLVGGTGERAPAECLLPGATRFTPLPKEASFALSADAVALEDGKVFMVDGASGQCGTWDGKNRYTLQTTLARPRIFFRATRLKDGRVLITGGWPSGQSVKGRASRVSPSGPLPVECFNPRWGTLSSWKALPQTRARHQAELLPDGRICLWAGYGVDATGVCETMELLEPGKETVTVAGQLALQGNAMPAWAGGLFLAERAQGIIRAGTPEALLGPAAAVPNRLANGFLTPTLVPLAGNRVLVLGTPAWGVPVDRWDPRSRLTAVVSSLRPGANNLALAPGGKVLVLGPVVDQLDPRSGVLKPLGWREELETQLKTAKPSVPYAGPVPPFAQGAARKDYLVVVLDKTRALVVGGIPEGASEPCGNLELWDQKKKTLTSLAPMKTRRAFPAQPGSAQGGLLLPDGSVLVWGAGKE